MQTALMNLSRSTRVKRKEFWLAASDGVVAFQEVAKTTREASDMQGVLSAVAATRRKQDERHWQFQRMQVNIPGERGAQGIWLSRRNVSLEALKDGNPSRQRKVEAHEKVRKNKYCDEDLFQRTAAIGVAAQVEEGSIPS